MKKICRVLPALIAGLCAFVAQADSAFTDRCRVTRLEPSGDSPAFMLQLYCDHDLVALGGVSGGFEDNHQAAISANFRVEKSLAALQAAGGSAHFTMTTNFAGELLALDGVPVPPAMTPLNNGPRKIESPVALAGGQVRVTFLPILGETSTEPVWVGATFSSPELSLQGEAGKLVLQFNRRDLDGVTLDVTGDYLQHNKILEDEIAVVGSAAKGIRDALNRAGVETITSYCRPHHGGYGCIKGSGSIVTRTRRHVFCLQTISNYQPREDLRCRVTGLLK